MKKRIRKIVVGILVSVPVIFFAAVLFINVFDWNHARPILAKISRATTVYEVQVSGDWKMHLGRNFELSLTNFAVQAEDYPKGSPPLLKAEQFFIRIPVASVFKGRLAIDHVLLKEADVHLVRGEQGKLVFLPPEDAEKDAEKKSERSAPMRIPELREIDIQKFALNFEDRALNETASLSIDRIRSLAGKGIEPIHIQGKGRLEQQPFSLNATWEDSSGKNTGPFDLAVLLVTGKNRIVIEGTVALAENAGLPLAQMEFQADLKDPARIMRMIGIPSQKPVPFSFRGQIASEGESVRLENVALKSSRSEIETHGVIGTKERRPYITLNIEADPFDLRDVESYLPVAENPNAAKKPSPQQPAGPVFSRQPINVNALHSFDAEIAFNVKKIRAEEALAILESLRGNAILKSGDLSVSIDKLGLGGGHLNGQTALSSHKEDGLKIESRGKFTHIALPAAAKQIDKKLKDAPLPLDSLFKGKVSGDFALKSHGRSLHDLASHLDGVLSFALEGGELNAALLNLTNLNIIDAVKAWFAKQRGLKVPCIIAHLPIKDGVIRSEGVYANPALGEVLGDGYVDLGQEKYDIRFAAKGDQPIGSDVIFPLRFSGKFGEGRVTRDEGQDSADTSIKEALPHAHQKSVRVEQTEESTGCTKELRERYLPAKVALGRP